MFLEIKKKAELTIVTFKIQNRRLLVNKQEIVMFHILGG